MSPYQDTNSNAKTAAAASQGRCANGVCSLDLDFIAKLHCLRDAERANNASANLSNPKSAASKEMAA